MSILAKRPALRLRKTEEDPEQTKQTEACPEKSGFACPIPGCWTQHPRGDNIIQNTKNIVSRMRKHNSLIAQN
jgi:hypothetical protein